MIPARAVQARNLKSAAGNKKNQPKRLEIELHCQVVDLSGSNIPEKWK